MVARPSVEAPSPAALALALVFAGCGLPPAEPAGPASGDGKGDVIGDDDRQQVGDAADPRVGRWAAGVAIVTRASRLAPAPGGLLEATTRTLGDTHQLCPDERFADEPVLGFCSAFLIAPEVVVTAGHCASADVCDDLAFVFDFHDGGASADPTHIPRDRVFQCDAVLARALEGGLDYALIQLDRAAVGRPLFTLDAALPTVGANLAMIGFPSGIWAKVDLAGEVIATRAPRIESTLDSFGGHSGAVVIDLDTGHAIAVHTAGNRPQYVMGEACAVTAACSEADVRAGACAPSIERSVAMFAGPTAPPPAAPMDPPVCLEPGGPCARDADCAALTCTCEGDFQVSESFVAADGRCEAGACVGDALAACTAACTAADQRPSTWGTACPAAT